MVGVIPSSRRWELLLRRAPRFIVPLSTIALLLLILVSFWKPFFPSSPDEAGVNFFAKNQDSSDPLVYSSPLNKEFNTTIFGPRYTFTFEEDRQTTFYPWFAFSAGLFGQVISIDLFLFASNFLLLITVFLAARRISSDATAAVGALCLAATVPFLFYANKMYSNQLAAMFLALAMLSLFVAPAFSWKSRSLTIAFAVLALLSRDDTIVAMPFLLVLMISRWRPLFQNRNLVLIGLAIGAAFVTSLLLARIVTAQYDIGTNLREKLEGFIGAPGDYRHAVETYLLGNFIFWPLAVLALVPVRRHFAKAPLVIGVSILAFVFAFGSRSATWRFYEGTPDASLQRYFLIPLVFLSLLLAVGAHRCWKRGTPRFFVPLLGLLILVPLVLLPDEPGQAIREEQARLERIETGMTPINGLDSSWVYFTKFNDKYVSSGSLNLAIYRTEADLVADPDENLFFEPSSLTELEQMVIVLMERGYSVIIDQDASDLVGRIRERGLQVARFEGSSAFRVS